MSAGGLLFIYIKQFAEIMSEAQPNTEAARCHVALEDECGEQAGRTMLDRQGVRKTKVVFRDDIRIDRSHHTSPSGCALQPPHTSKISVVFPRSSSANLLMRPEWSVEFYRLFIACQLISWLIENCFDANLMHFLLI